jgi:hypothetical protein
VLGRLRRETDPAVASIVLRTIDPAPRRELHPRTRAR